MTNYPKEIQLEKYKEISDTEIEQDIHDTEIEIQEAKVQLEANTIIEKNSTNSQARKMAYMRVSAARSCIKERGAFVTFLKLLQEARSEYNSS